MGFHVTINTQREGENTYETVLAGNVSSGGHTIWWTFIKGKIHIADPIPPEWGMEDRINRMIMDKIYDHLGHK